MIILDEGQNATIPQMKMFLTRMGQNARIVVTGDPTQTDLPPDHPSGLIDAVDRLRDVPGVGIVRLTRADIVRHPLVQAIVDAYENIEAPRTPMTSAIQTTGMAPKSETGAVGLRPGPLPNASG